MARTLSAITIFCRRMKAARLALGISQAELGRRIGLEAGVASTRVNRYELGVHTPDFDTAARIAKQLGVPLAYLFAGDERLAEAIRLFVALSPTDQERMLVTLAEGPKASSKLGKAKPTRKR